MMATMKLIVSIVLYTISITFVSTYAQLYNPYWVFFRYNAPHYNNYATYANQIPSYSSLHPTYQGQPPQDYPTIIPNMNIIAEAPLTITTKFTVVPMMVVSKENMNLISKNQIIKVSNNKADVTIKTEKNKMVPCTPAVKIALEQPISVQFLKTNIVFPSEIQIVHRGVQIPIRVGAVYAPVPHSSFVSVDTPVTVSVVYAVPATTDYILSQDVHGDSVETPDTEAVVIESEPFLPPANVTIIDFPDKEAEPVLQVDEEDEELVNRGPPVVLAPAGIAQSTQPQTHVEPFKNPKESPLLSVLREESKKRI